MVYNGGHSHQAAKRVLELYDEGVSTNAIEFRLGIMPAGSARYIIKRSGRPLRSHAASRVAHVLCPLTESGRRRIEQDRQLVSMVVSGLSIREAGRRLDLAWSEPRSRYHGIYCRALRQYLWGEDCGLRRWRDERAAEYLRRQGVPRSLVAQLMGAEESAIDTSSQEESA